MESKQPLPATPPQGTRRKTPDESESLAMANSSCPSSLTSLQAPRTVPSYARITQLKPSEQKKTASRVGSPSQALKKGKTPRLGSRCGGHFLLFDRFHLVDQIVRLLQISFASLRRRLHVGLLAEKQVQIRHRVVVVRAAFHRDLQVLDAFVHGRAILLLELRGQRRRHWIGIFHLLLGGL